MRSLHLILALLSFVALSTSRGNDDPFRRDLLPRATPTSGEGSAISDNGPTSAAVSSSAAASSSAGSKDSKDSKSGSKNSKSGSASGSASGSGKTTGKNSKQTTSKKNGSASKSSSIPATAQVGSINMVTPAATDGYTIFKIGDPVTFHWNYTNLIVTPTAINVAAYCTDGASYFTITGNASADVTKVVWDTGEYQSTATVKLPVATYSLYIWDASKARTDVASPGYLSPALALTFGMYTPQPYTPLSDFTCATCNPNAAADMRRGLLAVLGMGVIAALSCISFVVGIL